MSISEIIDDYLIGKSLRLMKTTAKKTVKGVVTNQTLYSIKGYKSDAGTRTETGMVNYAFEVLEQESVTLPIIGVDINSDYAGIEVVIELEGGLNWYTDLCTELPLV